MGFQEAAQELESLGLVKNTPEPAATFTIRAGYAHTPRWSRSKRAKDMLKPPQARMRENDLVAWDVRSLDVTALPTEERQRLGLPEPWPGRVYHVDPNRSAVFRGQLIFPWDAIVGADGTLLAGYAYSSHWGQDLTASASAWETWYWDRDVLVTWEVSSCKCRGLGAAERELLGLPEPAEDCRYLVDASQAFILDKRLVFPTDALCGHAIGGEESA